MASRRNWQLAARNCFSCKTSHDSGKSLPLRSVRSLSNISSQGRSSGISEEAKPWNVEGPVNFDKYFEPKQDDVLLERDGQGFRLAYLNRPKTLNALTLDMVRKLSTAVVQWERNSQVKLIALAGVGERAFCAGGDIRWIADKARDPAARKEALDFFREEYQLNYYLGTAKTPVVAFMKGITMGGGVGLSVHCKYRVAHKDTLFAMPETQIGLIPDIGGSYFLPRLTDSVFSGRGFYLGLTGLKLRGIENVEWGVATHFVEDIEPVQLKNLVEGINFRNSWPQWLQNEMLDTKVDFIESGEDHGVFFDEARIAENEEKFYRIDQIFGMDSDDKTVEEIMELLLEDGSDWAMEAHNAMKRASPLSLKVTFRQLKSGMFLDFASCLEMEYGIVKRILDGNDFFEGVRAQIIDKDRKPKWSPATLAEVSDDMVAEFFEPLPEEERLNIKEHEPYSRDVWTQQDRKREVKPKNPEHLLYDPNNDPELQF